MTHKPSFLPRDPGDAWVEGPNGAKYWGLFGAAGLLVHDRARGILLQHRAEWSHFGGTWGLPGGARHENEAALSAALREASEEASVPPDALEVLFETVLDLGYWSYTTVVAVTTRPFEPVIADPESLDLQWIALDAVSDLPLHPRFEEAWPTLRDRL